MVKGQEYHLDIRESDTTDYIMNLTGSLEGDYKDTATIRRKLRQSLTDMRKAGFLAASYDRMRIKTDTVRMWLHVGQKYHWGKFSITTPDSSLLQTIPSFQKIREQEVINLNELNALEKRVVTQLENQGYPFASVKISQLENAGSDTLNASLVIDPGKRYVIDSILIKGNDRVSEKYLYPYLELFPGMVYNENKLQKIPDKIENLAFLRQIRDFELEFSEGQRVNVFLYLEKAASNQAEGVVGFLPKGDGKIHFTGAFDLSLSNLFRRGGHIDMNWNSLEEQSQELKLNMNHPYLILQSVGINADFELFKKDTSFLSRTFRAGLSFDINSRSWLEVFGHFEKSSLLSESGVVTNKYEPFQTRLYGISYNFNNLDYRLNPSRGMYLDVSGSVGKRKRGKDRKRYTGAEAGLDISWYQPFFRSWVIKTSGHGRYKHFWSEDKKDFRENELYRFGGFNSLRGFDDNAFLAPAYSVITLELRYMLARNSNIYTFWDGGWYYNNIPSAVRQDFLFGFGLGAHIDTGGGIMYISYAMGKQHGNPIDIGSSKIHLGYVNRF
ncbi:MAG: BamA/TamA family outer membrane protein [Bacteroidales bacterium]|nr:BamA/TamA family outer membrane protein [Bacteroidales bacterium]MBS3777390.1 BamA/TamA family outer membrane protein [Bacteroidales bacterium]